MILFKVIRWKNLLSTGNQFIEVELCKDKSTIIVGLNGAGKSTILDALCFVLFGKPFRDINKPILLNNNNRKDLVVEVEFESVGKQFKIVRGIKPNLFEVYCEGVLIDQDSKARDYQEYLEKYILKMNYKSFTQIVILGSASFKPFMQLSASDRRTIIEDLLDIQIFSMMNVVAKQKLQAHKDKITELTQNIRVFEEKKSVIENTLSKLEENNEKKILELQAKLDEQNVSLDLVRQEKQKLLKQYIDFQIADEKKFKSRHTKLIMIGTKMSHNLTKHEEHIRFYEVNDDCPVCKQAIDQKFKSNVVQESAEQVNKLKSGLIEIQEEIKSVNKSIQEIEDERSRRDEIKAKIRDKEASEVHILRNVKYFQDELNKPREDTTVLTNKDSLDQLEKDIQDSIFQLNHLSNDKEYLDTAITLLKDGGIKTRIIKQYLPVINKQINTYLSAMEFPINFEIDDNFKETIKSQYRSDFTYNSFSEGEKMRIDLALLFTWRTVAKLKNAVNTNLLILDEVFDSSLDTNGTDDFMKIIGVLVNSSNVFVISHKGDQLQDKFERVLKFTKERGFSKLL